MYFDLVLTIGYWMSEWINWLISNEIINKVFKCKNEYRTQKYNILSLLL